MQCAPFLDSPLLGGSDMVLSPMTTHDLPAAGTAGVLPCQQPDLLELWFAERGDDVEQAKAMCGPCPVRDACLAGALARQEPWGVWGGEVFVDGSVVARKRGRGRPRKSETVAA